MHTINKKKLKEATLRVAFDYEHSSKPRRLLMEHKEAVLRIILSCLEETGEETESECECLCHTELPEIQPEQCKHCTPESECEHDIVTSTTKFELCSKCGQAKPSPNPTKECTCKIGQEIFPDGIDMCCPIHGDKPTKEEPTRLEEIREDVNSK